MDAADSAGGGDGGAKKNSLVLLDTVHDDSVRLHSSVLRFVQNACNFCATKAVWGQMHTAG